MVVDGVRLRARRGAVLRAVVPRLALTEHGRRRLRDAVTASTASGEDGRQHSRETKVKGNKCKQNKGGKRKQL